MSPENQQPACQQLFTQLNELKSLRAQFAAEAEIFTKNPQYERVSYRGMMERLDGFETKFRQIYKYLLGLNLLLTPELREKLRADYDFAVAMLANGNPDS